MMLDTNNIPVLYRIKVTDTNDPDDPVMFETTRYMIPKSDDRDKVMKALTESFPGYLITIYPA